MKWYDELHRLLEFQEKSAQKIRIDPTHEDHDDYFNERYWHGFEAAMRYCKNRLRDYSVYPKIIPKIIVDGEQS